MSLLLSSHFFSLPTVKTAFHHRNNHHLLSPLTLIPPLNPPKTPNFLPIYANYSDTTSETLPKSAIQRIADKLRSLGYVEENLNHQIDVNQSIGEVLLPNPTQIDNHRVGYTLDPSWSTPHNPVPDPGSGKSITRLNELTRVARTERKEERERGKGKKEVVPSLAEMTLSRSDIRRLVRVGMEMKQKMKVGRVGISEGIVNGIHERWRSFEVVRIVCDDVSKLNMKRTHDLLEVREFAQLN